MDEEMMEDPTLPEDEAMEGEGMEDEGMEGEAAPPNDALRKVTLAERKILYSQPTSDKIVKILQSAPDPVQGLASAAMLVLSAMNEAAQGKIPPEVAPQLREVLLQDLAELSDAAGIDVPEGTVEAAAQMMTQAVQQAGKMRQQGAQPAMQRGGPRPEAPQPAAPPQGLIAQGM
jgi:hypothetical protein